MRPMSRFLFAIAITLAVVAAAVIFMPRPTTVQMETVVPGPTARTTVSPGQAATAPAQSQPAVSVAAAHPSPKALIAKASVTKPATPIRTVETSEAQPLPDHFELPLIFERNAGQFPVEADYVSKGQGYSVALTGPKALFALDTPGEEVRTVSMALANQSCDATPIGEEAYSGPTNYFIGNDPSQWLRGVQSFRKVRYDSVYPGVDLLFHGTSKRLEYDFVVAPAANPDTIALEFEGMDALEIDEKGALVLRAGKRELRHDPPIAYQTREDGTRDSVEASFRKTADGQVAFDLGAYDATRELVIDPILEFSTPLSRDLLLNAVSVDQSGNIWVAGEMQSEFTGFPAKATPGTYQRAWNRHLGRIGTSSQADAVDVVLFKLNPAASDVLLVTYLGGRARETPKFLHVTPFGQIIIAGLTESYDFPVTDNAFLRALPTDDDSRPVPLAFVTRMGAEASSLVYSTHIAFAGDPENVADITVDAQERVILVGKAVPRPNSFTPIPVTQDREPGPDGPVYLMRLTADGSALDLGFRFGVGGGSEFMAANAVALDSSGNIYMAGTTQSHIRTTPNAAQPECGYASGGANSCSYDAFLAKFTATGETVFTTYWGGSGGETVTDISVAPNGDIIMAGNTAVAFGEQNDFPLVNAPITSPGNTGGFLARFSQSGAVLLSTYAGVRPSTVKFNSAGQLFVGHDTGTQIYEDGALATKSWDHVVASGLHPVNVTTDTNGNFYFVGAYTLLPAQPPLTRFEGVQPMFSNRQGHVSKINVANGGNQNKFVRVFPEGGRTTGNQPVTVFGLFGLVPVDLYFGGVQAPKDSVTFYYPPHPPGVVDVEVVDISGAHYLLKKGFTYVTSAISIASISPTTLSHPRDAEITIKGTGFFPGIVVYLIRNGIFNRVTSARVIDDTTIVGIVPRLDSGTYFVRVTTPLPIENQSATLTIGGLSVTGFGQVGSVNGGDTVTMSGGGFQPGVSVLLDGIAATDVVVGSGGIGLTFKTPSHPQPRWVDLTLRNGGNDFVFPKAFRYIGAKPSINANSLTPTHGPHTGGNHVTFTGFGFKTDDLITVDGIVLTQSQKTFIDANTWLITMPPHHPGPAPVIVTDQGGAGMGGGFESIYTYDGPLITSISPTEGLISGGTEVVISGTGFDPAAVVKFGGVTATRVPHASMLIVTTPPHAAGRVDVEVTNPDGSKGVLGNAYLYKGPAPEITGISPNSGGTAGGTVVTITGTNFTNGATVKFDDIPATNVQFINSTTLTATTPPHPDAEPVNFRVTNPDHQFKDSSNTGLSFTYRPGPVATTLNPAAGPEAGGTSVVITGTTLDPAIQVTFGGVPAASITHQSSTQITVVTPAHAAGDVDVVLTNPDGISSTKVNGFRYLLPPPTLTSFTPASGPPATQVTITGTNFMFVTDVKFNNVPASFTVNSLTQITATVPNNTATGPITVTTPSGVATSATDFTFESIAPQVDSFTPAFGPAGTVVTLTGIRFTNANQVQFGGVSASSFTVNSATQITVTAPANGLTGPICVSSPGPFTGCSATDFAFPPNVSSFTPSSGPTGTSVTINGSNFQGATSVTFGGGAAASPFTVDPAGTSITTTVPGNAITGPITVTGPAGSGTSTGIFSLPPTISGFSPSRGGPGNSITISGLNLTGASEVRFNGVNAGSFTVVNDSTVTATVPLGATNGPITVTTGGGTATSATDFEIAQTPVISSFTPTMGAPGTVVTITGTNFPGSTDVRFNGASASFVIDSPTQITATVPAGATNGPISITNPEGTGASQALFYLPPVLSSFSPSAAEPGTVVTIVGNNFVGATSVTFNGKPATFVINAQDRITTTVPTGATTGTLTVTTPYGPASGTFAFTVLGATTPSMIAVATSTTSVTLSWTGNATHTYEVRRIDQKSGSFVTGALTRTTGNTYVDPTALPGRTYLYNILNVSNGLIGNNDYATTIMFTDDPLVAGMSVKSVHLTELRTAVNAMRHAASLSPTTWAEAVPPGALIRATHISELRTALTEALIELGRFIQFSDPSLSAGMGIRTSHVHEVREAVK